MVSVLLEFSMFPTDVGESKSEYVSKVVEHVRKSGYPYQLTPMATIVEAQSIEEALELVKECYYILEQSGCNRIYSVLKFDIRKNQQNRMKSKIESVVTKIGDVNK
ncbi:MTH1187 family thiamine-binding protein [Arcobacter sp. FWKO B]|uniref:MTH1187 family thiamine-binding protein n=1 Tax=Arcobacter sp. FWKO B TaxID=2593672 RepID=UPI0018A3BC30|nr:MTH1187 family thiamine-binding protein [Arcobacter sp. FWKO B]QOG12279.1 MTH1187 family thiamine-binding protein [Arcobacter sp. FWKO B]